MPRCMRQVRSLAYRYCAIKGRTQNENHASWIDYKNKELPVDYQPAGSPVF
jgi:hypothetical protein